MRKSLLAFWLLLACPLIIAQQTMNNAAVIKLVKAGLSDDVIVSTINASSGSYDTSADALVALKSAGVSDKVIGAIIVKGNAPASSTAQPPASIALDPNDPASPHDPGVYLMSASHDGKQKMIFIDRAGSGNEKTAGILAHAFTYGIVKAKMKAELAGARAAARTQDAQPVFYMYFPPMSNAAGLGGTDSITSPEQFSLLLLEEKKDHRETSIAKVGFASMSMGNDEKKVFKFKSERVRSNVYKLSPSENLKRGEYAFIASTRMAGTATGATVVIYDFGVDLQ